MSEKIPPHSTELSAAPESLSELTVALERFPASTLLLRIAELTPSALESIAYQLNFQNGFFSDFATYEESSSSDQVLEIIKLLEELDLDGTADKKRVARTIVRIIAG